MNIKRVQRNTFSYHVFVTWYPSSPDGTPLSLFCLNVNRIMEYLSLTPFGLRELDY